LVSFFPDFLINFLPEKSFAFSSGYDFIKFALAGNCGGMGVLRPSSANFEVTSRSSFSKRIFNSAFSAREVAFSNSIFPFSP
jgi:hypothetical protein